jgi:hemoglobin-like flavoprotein
MSPDQLAELRRFLGCVESRLPEAIDAMFGRLLEAAPEVRHLFKGDLQQQQKSYLSMLRQVVVLTRSHHLWPVQAFGGTASIPAIDKLGSFHSCLGVSQEHFAIMRDILVECFWKHCPEDFTPGAEEALRFIFDVLAKASTGTCRINPDYVASKNAPPQMRRTVEPGSFSDFFGGEAHEDAC